jgi:hypothetical protein
MEEIFENFDDKLLEKEIQKKTSKEFKLMIHSICE